MSPPLACPHCQSVLPPGPPGVLHCGRCGKPYTIPSVEQLAVEAKRRSEERNVLLVAGALFFVFYVGPVLLTAVYMAAIFFVYLVFFIAFAASAAAG